MGRRGRLAFGVIGQKIAVCVEEVDPDVGHRANRFLQSHSSKLRSSLVLAL
jgi:uncharacterized protein (DUF1810 family)